MPRSTKEQTGNKLRDAVVAEAIENGIGAVGVSAVVARAKISAGTIYVHFKNKDDMLAQVYLDLKAELHARVFDGVNRTNTSKMIHQMWSNMFAFVNANPRDFLFLEYCSTAKLLNADQQRVVDGYTDDIESVLQRGIDDGTLAPLSRHMLTLMLIAPAERLARRSVLSGEKIPTETIEQIFDRVWLSISNSA